MDRLFDRFRNHDRLALSRLMTLVARGEQVPAISHFLDHTACHGRVVALTGSAGVGKSTLIGKVVERARGEGESVAVLACDPESPLTGGALLGDRIRMQNQGGERVFIRSLSVPSGQQSVAENVRLLARLAQAFGFSTVLLETVGAGQGDTVAGELSESRFTRRGARSNSTTGSAHPAGIPEDSYHSCECA